MEDRRELSYLDVVAAGELLFFCGGIIIMMRGGNYFDAVARELLF